MINSIGEKSVKDFLELARERKTTYNFEEKQVSEKDVAKILEAARWAPSCTNAQPWNFIIVQDKRTIGELMSTANYGDFHTDPPLIIAIVLREDLCAGEGHACFRGKDSSVHDSYMSCGIAASHMALEAEDIGINSCIVTPEQNKVKRILKVKENDAVPLLVGIGYQTKNAFQKKRERRPIGESVSYESFGKGNGKDSIKVKR